MWWRFSAFVVLLSMLVAAPTRAQSIEDQWLAEFFDSRFFGGEKTTVFVENVAFDWGDGAPLAEIGADDFSVRFVTRRQFAAGTYRFFARGDDEVRVTVDNRAIIDTFDSPRIGETLSADVQLSNGDHQIQVDYRERTGVASVFVTWENAALNPAANFPLPSELPAIPAPVSVQTSSWTAQYYGNDNLQGLPTAIFSEDSPGADWGDDSPVVSVPDDNFSARWTTTTDLEAGTYRVTVRADDGVRVFVDGREVIDQWDGRVGETYTADVPLGTGPHNFTVEYNEQTGDAYLEFDLGRIEFVEAAPPPVAAPANPPPATTSAFGTVSSFRLNVRDAPTTDASVILRIDQGAQYPIVGRNADTSWWQIDLGGRTGWVFARFFDATNASNVPVVSSVGTQPDVVLTGQVLTTTARVNLRSGPGRSNAVLAVLPQGTQADIAGQNSTGDWIQVQYSGLVGWVSTTFSTGYTQSSIPVVR